MAKYTIKLRDGSIFTGERNLLDKLKEGFFEFRFRKTIGAEAPKIDPGDVLYIPTTSILYIVKERR